MSDLLRSPSGRFETYFLDEVVEKKALSNGWVKCEPSDLKEEVLPGTFYSDKD